MPEILNWELLRSPYNWITVFLMCSFALVFLAIVFPQPTADQS